MRLLEDDMTNPDVEAVEALVKEFQGMRPLVSGVGDEAAKHHLQTILDMWWKEAAVYSDWLRSRLTTLLAEKEREAYQRGREEGLSQLRLILPMMRLRTSEKRADREAHAYNKAIDDVIGYADRIAARSHTDPHYKPEERV